MLNAERVQKGDRTFRVKGVTGEAYTSGSAGFVQGAEGDLV